MAVSKRLRFEILRRDNHTCRYCGASAPDVPLRIDHVTPVALGGTDTADNLVTSCEPCNNGKTSTTPDATHVAQVADDAVRWAAAMKQAADKLAAAEVPKVEYREAFLAEWNRWGRGSGDNRKPVELPGDWAATLERFRLAGLPSFVWKEIVDTAMGYDKVKDVFKYCCGIAWNKVAALHAEARRIANPAPDHGPGSGRGVADALVTVALHVWTTTCDAPDAEQSRVLTEGVREAFAAERECEDILRAVQQGAFFADPRMDEAFRIVAKAEQAQAESNWVNAWIAITGEHPPLEKCETFWAHCEALYERGVGLPEMRTAGFVAGYHLSTVPHYGIPVEDLMAVGIRPYYERAIDLWKRAYQGATGRWPSQEQVEQLDQNLKQVAESGDFAVGDALAAVVSAAAAQENELCWNATRLHSALLAAEIPFPRAGA